MLSESVIEPAIEKAILSVMGANSPTCAKESGGEAELTYGKLILTVPLRGLHRAVMTAHTFGEPPREFPASEAIVVASKRALAHFQVLALEDTVSWIISSAGTAQ